MTARAVLCFGLLLFFAARGEAQTTSAAWHPLPNAYENDRYDYTKGSSEVPTHIIWAIDQIIAGGDTTWLLKLDPSPCDSCAPFGQPSLHFPGLAIFRGMEMKHEDNGRFTFRHPDSCQLLTKAKLGESWSFNSTTIAEVVDVYDSVVFQDITDSIKQIQLSSGDTILLSRRHGLLRFPSSLGNGDSLPYRLSGIKGRDLGLYIPGWRDIFQIDSGTELHYRHHLPAFDVSILYANIIHVGQREEGPDTIRMAIRGVSNRTKSSTSPYDPYINDATRYTGWLVATAETSYIQFSSWDYGPAKPPWYTPHSANKKPFETWNHDIACEWYYDLLHMMRPFLDENDRMNVRNVGLEAPGGLPYDSVPYVFAEEWWSPCFDQHVAVGLGVVHCGFHAGEWTYASTILSGYRINGQAFGTLLDSTNWPLGHQSINASVSFGIHPNPSTGQVIVSGWDQPANASIFSLTGRRVLEHPFQPGTPIDLSALPNGLYWIELQNKDQRGLAKVSLMRP